MISTRASKPNLIVTVLLVSALVIQTFSYSLSFYDGLVDGGLIQVILDFIYLYRNICLFSSIAILVFYSAFPKDSLVFIALVVFGLLLSFALHPKNLEYFQEVQTNFILCIDAFLIIRSNLVDIELFKKVIRVFCWGLSLLAIYTFITQQASLLFIEQYMDYSNAVSIVSAFLLYFGLNEGKKIDLLLGIITYLVLFVAGGRGAFLTLSLLIVGLIWLRSQSKKIIYIIAFLGIILLCFPNLVLDVIRSISSLLDFNSRTIESLLSNELLRGNDRYQLYSYLFDRVIGDFFLGGGICADRYYLDIGHLTDNGYYAHNILIELLVDFGILGLLLFLYIISQIYRFLKKYQKKKTICGFVMVYMVVAFVQLFFSRSLLTEPNFFVLIGLLIYYNKYYYERKAVG